MPLKILLVTYYFPPDLSAGSFRAKALVEAMLRKTGTDIQIDVLTTEPNRYRSHTPENVGAEDPRYSLTRLSLPKQRWGILGQIRSFIRFARLSRRATKSAQYDVVIATSSRLMTAVLGRYLASRLQARLYLDIRDIFVETIGDVFPRPLVGPMLRVFSRLERYAIDKADRVNLVSRGFLTYFQVRYNRRDYRFFTNGVDQEFLDAARFQCAEPPAVGVRVVEIVYAGNIGAGQGLEMVVPDLAKRLQGRAHFTVIGDGGTLQRLMESCANVGADVTFVGAVPRSQLMEQYRRADVLFLHLNDVPAFERVLPSKIFEYAATGKPVLAGVSGYARQFLETEVEGACVFDPTNVDAAVSAFEALDIRPYERPLFIEKFARERIMDDMASDILTLAQGDSV